MSFSLWLSLFILSGTLSPFFPYWTPTDLGWGEVFIFQCYVFLPFHRVHAVLKARILKWFATPFYTGPHFVLPWLAATFPSATSCSWMTCRAPCLFHCWSSLSVETFTGHWMLVNVLPRGWSTGSTGVTRKGFHGRWNCCWKMPRSWGHPSLSAAIGHG